MRWLIAMILFLGVLMPAFAVQDTLSFATGDHVLRAVVVDDDTLLLSSISELKVYRRPVFKNSRQRRRYNRLVRNVKVVYPYAKLAGEKYDTVSMHMLTLDTERERRKYINQVEEEIKEEFEGDLKELTISQGRILLKLIDRETGETSYALLKDLKNSFSAVFWQTLARLFGHNLKSEFDPKGEDKVLNEIVLMIEAGQL